MEFEWEKERSVFEISNSHFYSPFSLEGFNHLGRNAIVRR